MRLLICGDRNWTDEDLIRRKIIEFAPTVVIEGEARGADSIAAKVARELGIAVEGYPAKWELYGRGAGPIRNLEMLAKGKPDRVLAFHDNITESKGTKHMVALARKVGKPVTVVGH